MYLNSLTKTQCKQNMQEVGMGIGPWFYFNVVQYII